MAKGPDPGRQPGAYFRTDVPELRGRLPGFLREHLTFNIGIVPDPAQIESQLLNMGNLIRDMTAPLEAARDVLAAGTHRRFATQTDPDGIPWRPWSASYTPRALREIASGIHQGLILQRSLLMQHSAEHPAAYFVSYDSVFFSWNTMPVYAPVQNFGGQVGGAMVRSVIPARPFIGADAQDQDTITVIFYRWLNWLVAGGSAQNVIGAGGRFISITGSAFENRSGQQVIAPTFLSPTAPEAIFGGYSGFGGEPFR